MMISKLLQHDQHFLNNINVVKASIKAAELNKNDTVLEIGPGKGILTTELAKKCKEVVAIEIDESLKAELAKMPKNVEILYGNALKLINEVHFNKIVANIPYSITEPLFGKLLKLEFEAAVLLIGQNFYELLNGKEKWGIISKLFFEVDKVMDVPKDNFEPRPRTDSVLVKITPRKKLLSEKEKIMKELILQDDKKLKNALMFAQMRIRNITKNQAREEMEKIKLAQEWWDKRVMHLSGVQFEMVVKEIVG
ncbi:16S rRNA methyltransferase [Candidatus Woesearchaeota archaeon]|nr:16S rRNA methyltransferase [Candidatus Woesearchaeota archaeon]